MKQRTPNELMFHELKQFLRRGCSHISIDLDLSSVLRCARDFSNIKQYKQDMKEARTMR